jgi:hypothetical protein
MAEGEDGDSRRGVGADARKCEKVGRQVRHDACVTVNDGNGRGMQP